MSITNPVPACRKQDHYADRDGWLRCRAITHQLPKRLADSKVCPYCGRHFTPARGAAIVHVRACSAS